MALTNPEEIKAELPHLTDDQIAVLIRDVEAVAAVHAPCITNPAFAHKDAARAVIKKAIVYEVQSREESNNVKRESMGPYSTEYATPTRSGSYFSNAQIETLTRLCPSAAPAPGMYSLQAKAAW